MTADGTADGSTTEDDHGTTMVETGDGSDDQGVSDAQLEISGGSTLDFGFVLLESSSVETLTVENVGGSAALELGALIRSDAFGFAGAEFPGEDGTCGGALAPGETCTIVLEFRPSAPVMSTGEIVLFHVNADGIPGAEVEHALLGGGMSDNLIVNGDGELGEAGGTPPEGWVAAPDPDDEDKGIWEATACQRAGSPHAGERCLGHADMDGGETGNVTEIQQIVQLPAWDELIDAGEIRFEFSGVARSRDTGNDDWKTRVVFLSATRGLAPMYDTDWQTTAQWETIGASVVAPPETRRVIVRLYCRMNFDGDYCDAFFDDLVLRAVPAGKPMLG